MQQLLINNHLDFKINIETLKNYSCNIPQLQEILKIVFSIFNFSKMNMF